MMEMEQYIMILRQSCDAQAEQIRRLRSLRHDMQAHLVVLQFYLQEKEYEKASEYLRQIREVQDNARGRVIDVGNAMLNAVLTERWERCADDIVISYRGDLPEKVQICDYDLCVIFSNLFSNAIEACERLQKKEKEVEIQIFSKENGWGLSMKNPIEEVLDKENFGKVSTKSDREAHGFGMRHIAEAVGRNQGEMEITLTEEDVTIQIEFSC